MAPGQTPSNILHLAIQYNLHGQSWKSNSHKQASERVLIPKSKGLNNQIQMLKFVVIKYLPNRNAEQDSSEQTKVSPNICKWRPKHHASYSTPKSKARTTIN